MDLDSDMPGPVGVDLLVDHDLLHQSVDGGGIQLRDVGIRPDSLSPLAGIAGQLKLVRQLLMALGDAFLELSLPSGVKGTKERCIWGVFSSICTTAEIIVSLA